MAEGEETKTTALVLTALVTVLSLMPVSPEHTALMPSCPWTHRLMYQFFHAGLLHAVLNGWVLISAVFMYPTSHWMLLTAYVISATVPEALCPLPTLGMSGLVFALLGEYSFTVARKWYYQRWMLGFILFGILVPNINGWLHLYCYGLGVSVSFLTSPRYES